MFRKKTLRSMRPVTRKLAKLINDADSLSNRMTNLLEHLEKIERDSVVLHNMLNQRATGFDAHKPIHLTDDDGQHIDEILNSFRGNNP